MPADQPTPGDPKPRRKSKRGGRRPGAGAPKGNFNALKHGLRSRRFAAIGRLLAADPTVAEALFQLSKRHEMKNYKASQIGAAIFAAMFQQAKQIAGGRLNFEPPTHEWRSINREIAHISPAQIEAAVEKEISRDAQSEIVSNPQPTIRDQIRKSID